jgi:hypothetical protein
MRRVDAVDAMSTKRQIEIERIASILREEKFWTQRVYARDVFGCHVSPFSNGAVSFCLQGAEMKASGKVTHTSEAPIMEHCAALNDTSTYREVWDFLVSRHKASGMGKPEVLFDDEKGTES